MATLERTVISASSCSYCETVRTSAWGSPPDPGAINELTEREEEVWMLLPLLGSNKAIAARLIISMNTVRRHVASIMRKLRAANRSEAIVMAIRWHHLNCPDQGTSTSPK